MNTHALNRPTAPVVASNPFALDPRPAGGPLQAAFSRSPSWWDTPRRLWAAFAGVCLGAAVWWAVCAGAVEGARSGLRSVGRDTAPSIVAAGHLRAAVADVDANLVNLLLTTPGSAEARRAGETVRERRQEIAENLVRASENITFGELERVPLTTLAENVPAHGATLARTQSALGRSDGPAALAAERDAADGLRLFMEPAAVLLETNNPAALDRAYAGARAGGRRGLAGIVLIGGGLTLAPVGLQLWLGGGTRRLLNPGLAAATVLVAASTLWTGVALRRAGGRLRTGTEDAFASVRFLWQARALALGTNGEESRWLFDRDPARAAASGRAFLDGAARVAWRLPEAGRPAGAPGVALRASLERAGLRLPAEPGYLERELANSNYPGEREAAEGALKLFGEYFAVDQKIRALEAAGRHAAAVALCLSYAPGGSNGAFDRFDDALGCLLEINTREFDAVVASGQRALGGSETLAAAVALGTMGLGFAGLWPRLREYRD